MATPKGKTKVQIVEERYPTRECLNGGTKNKIGQLKYYLNRNTWLRIDRESYDILSDSGKYELK